MTYLELAVALVGILVSAQGFTAALDRLAERLGLQASMVGSVLAAIATALPETLIPLWALSVEHAPELSLGSTVGATLMLCTLTLGLVGSVVWVLRGARAELDFVASVRADLWIVLSAVAYGFLLLVFSPVPANSAVRTVEALPLWFVYIGRIAWILRHHKANPVENPYKAGWFWPMVAVGFSLLLMIGSSAVFVDQMQKVAAQLQIPVLLMAMLISPVATELPEKLNSVIWLRRNRDIAALGNITGAMAYQSCILTGLNVQAGSWVASPVLYKIQFITILAVCTLLLRQKWRALWLSAFSVLYLLFWIWI